MKPRSIFVFAVALMSALNCSGQSRCQATVEANVEIAHSDLTLADLLTPGSCAELRTAAAAIRLGSAPLEGSQRVLLGSAVRERIETVTSGKQIGTAPLRFTNVPQRIAVRRAGSRATCAEIEARIFPGSGTVAKRGSLRELECGANLGIAQDASVRQIGKTWDRATRSWIVMARCPSARECVPFAVRVGPEAVSGSSPGPRMTETPPHTADVLVRPGQPATLLWDESGIRVVVPSVCLDAGSAGEIIRARIVRSQQILRAIVVGRGELKAIS